MTKEVCPICDAGHLHNKSEKNTVEYKDHSGKIDMHFSLCDECGSEQANAKQLRQNKRAMVAYRKQVDGLLSGAEITAIRKRMGINKSEAAHIFGGGPVAFSKYEADDLAQSGVMDRFLRLAAAVPEARKNLVLPKKITMSTEGESSGRWMTVDVSLTTALKGASTVRKTIDIESEVDWKMCA